MKFPIRTKLFALTASAVLFGIVTYLALAVKLFRDDKISLVYELNASNVRTVSAQVDAELRKVVDKVKLLTTGHREAAWVRAVFEAEPDLISYTLHRPGRRSGEWRETAAHRNGDYLKLYGQTEASSEPAPVPFEKALERGLVAYNSTRDGGAPMISLAVAVSIQGDSRPYVAVADVRLDRILRLFDGRGIATVALVDGEGNVVAHPDRALVSAGASLRDIPIVQEALGPVAGLNIKSFDWNGNAWIGAFSPNEIGGLRTVSIVQEREAFRAAYNLIWKSVLLGTLLLTIALFATSRLARSFTRPIYDLLDGTDRLSRWEFTDSIHVSTGDEIEQLARSFNTMAGDIQDQRRRLDAHQAELERKVKERTAELEGQKKRAADAQEALVRTTRLASLGELAGSAAHEILNPVNNMNIRLERVRSGFIGGQAGDLNVLGEIARGWADAYRDGGWEKLKADLERPVEGVAGRKLIEEDLENLVGIANDSSQRLDSMKSDFEFLSAEMLRITKIIDGMRSLARVGGERRPLDVHVPIEGTLAVMGDFFEKKNVEIIRDFGSETRDRYAVVGDKDELIQVFSNLIRNAVQAVHGAGRRAGWVKVSTRRTESRVEIRVADNGGGIRPEHLGRIFETDFTTKSASEGTGLGLSICRRLTRAFGGDLEIEETVVGEGTVFLVWFPVVKVTAESVVN